MQQESRQVVEMTYHRRRLEEFRNSTVHRGMAITAAMHYCAEVGISPPGWLTKESAELLCNLLRSQRTTELGRHAGVLNRFRQDQIDLERWFAVNAVRDIRNRADCDQRIIEEESRFSPDDLEYHRANLTKRQKWLAYGTFPCASMYLRGSDAFIGPDAVKTSYRKIEAANASGHDRWCVFELNFLEQLGVAPNEGNQGKKLLHLFDLEP